MPERLPHVFLSSTFYDLRQVRADIAEFVESGLGYRLMASEYHTFPVEPTVDAVENCRRRVESDADLLILVIGGRYGSIPTGGIKSVTNIEYRAARAKGIPVYAFIHRDVLALLPLYEQNTGGIFAPVVDSPKVLAFISELRASGVWTFPFDLARDVVAALRVQFAYQMSRGLVLSARSHQASPVVRSLAGRAFQLAAEQPRGWEASLFVQVLEDEIEASEPLRLDHEARLVTGVGERVTEDDISSWLVTYTHEAQRLITAMKSAAHASINRGFIEGDVVAIIHGARQIGRLYRDGFEWAARLRRAHVPSDWQTAVLELSTMLDSFLLECRDFTKRAGAEIAKALSAEDCSAELNLTFNFNVPENPAFHAELERIRRKKGFS